MIAERGEGIREARRLDHHRVAGAQIDATREIDGLKRAGADQHFARVRLETPRRGAGRDDLAELGLALGDAVAERARALAAEHRRGKVRGAHELQRLAGRRSHRERDGVPRLPRDDADGLVDERAEHLVLAPGVLFRKRCDRPAAHRGKNLDGALALEVAVRGEEAYVLAVDEHVDEAAELAVAEHARRELGVAVGDLPGERRQVRGIDRERRVTAGRGAKGRGETDGDAHESRGLCPRVPPSRSAYDERNSSTSAAIAGPSGGESSVPL